MGAAAVVRHCASILSTACATGSKDVAATDADAGAATADAAEAAGAGVVAGIVVGAEAAAADAGAATADAAEAAGAGVGAGIVVDAEAVAVEAATVNALSLVTANVNLPKRRSPSVMWSVNDLAKAALLMLRVNTYA